MKLKIRIKKIKDNLYLASCLNFEGCHVQANKAEEAEKLLKAAIQAYIKSYKQRHENLPFESQNGK